MEPEKYRRDFVLRREWWWNLRRAAHIAADFMRHPYHRIHSSNWGVYDHEHICVASRLLEYDDFREVCPIIRDNETDCEYSDICDTCKYLRILKFNTNWRGDKQIEIEGDWTQK